MNLQCGKETSLIDLVDFAILGLQMGFIPRYDRKSRKELITSKMFLFISIFADQYGLPFCVYAVEVMHQYA